MQLVATLLVASLVRPAVASVAAFDSRGAGVDAQAVEVAISRDPKGRLSTIAVEIEGAVRTVVLRPHSVRSPAHYQVLMQQADGSMLKAADSETLTYRGEVEDVQGSIAAVSEVILGGQSAGGEKRSLVALLSMPDSEDWWIESSPDGTGYIAYQNSHAGQLGAAGPGMCGNTEVVEDDPDQAHIGSAEGLRGGTGETLCLAELAVDVDVQYFVSYGSSAAAIESRINAIVNAMNIQYERDVGVYHLLTTIIVRTAEPDPYSSSSANTLLLQLRNEWLFNQFAIQRDVVQLFTGRTMSGGVIGQAYALGAICTNNAYCFVWSDCCGSFACATDLSAHELGHLWGAPHCTCSNPSSTMNPQITCSNRFSLISAVNIMVHRDSRLCLECGTFGGGPDNDDCGAAIPVGSGQTEFDSDGATTDGPTEPLCTHFGYSQIGADIWYAYTPPCNGVVNVSVCSATFDTKLAVYGSSCPTASSAITCNDDACGTRSELQFYGSGGVRYLIRIGGFQAATGTGILDIGGPDCFATPDNDDCADAITIVSGQYEFETTGATTDGPVEPTLCSFADSTNVAADVWFRYIAPCNGAATLSLCGSLYDTKVAIYAGATCPTASSAIACNDDHDICGAGSLQSELTFQVTRNQTYLLRIGGYTGDTGVGLLTLADPDCPAAPANDPCGNPTQISAGDRAFTTVGAASDGPAHASCTDQFGADIWYFIQAPCTGTLLASTCGQAAFDTIVAVYSGLGCSNLDNRLIACNDDADGCAGFTSRATAAVTVGLFYTIRVAGFGSATGTGTLHVECQPAAPPATGACCMNTTCVITTGVECANVSGTWQGAGTVCSPNPCIVVPPPPATGACCASDGSCSLLTESSCAAQAGSLWQGADSTCAGITCPSSPSTGSCCAAGACTILTREACESGGGYWFGAGTTCQSHPCPARPANDDCIRSIQIMPGTRTFSTLSATDDGPQHPACAPDQGSDIWYLIQAQCTGELAVSTCATADFDTVVSIYSGIGCSSLDGRLLACNDDDESCAAFTSRVATPAVFGRFYTIRIAGFEGRQGQGTLTVSCTVPPPPPVTGACCAANFGGCTVATESACLAAGSIWQGASTPCSPDPCPHPPACPCDWNGADGLDSQDYFDFLSDFFDGIADFSGDGATDSQDLFEFLECFFNGCP